MPSMPAAAAPPLSLVLLESAHHVQQVWEGRSLTECLADTAPELRAASQAISFYVLRELGLARQLRAQLLARKPAPQVDALLCVALAVLNAAVLEEAESDSKRESSLHDGGRPQGAGEPYPEEGLSNSEGVAPRRDRPRYAVHTVVDQAVEAAQAEASLRPFKSLINASLRRFLREREALIERAQATPEGRWNFPGWWVRRIKKAYPKDWEAILATSNRPGPLSLRVNARRCTVPQLLEAFDQAGIQAWHSGEQAVIVAQPVPVTQLPGFAEGWWSVQDVSAQQAGALLPVQDGMRVLDACAAPGGKTAHLLEQAALNMVALDVDARRLRRVRENLQRLGLWGPSVQTVVGDAAELSDWWDGEPFDAILADVPCTASGIVRRHPDIRWLRRDSDVQATAALQERIVDALWQTLKPGGHLLYVTCSIFPQEGEVQARAFQYRHPDAQALPAPGQVLPQATEFGQPSGDGFFYALFRKDVVDLST